MDTTNSLSNLKETLLNLNPYIASDILVYIVLAHKDIDLIRKTKPIAYISEEENFTLLLRKKEADLHQFKYTREFHRIEFQAPFQIFCVGFIAIISTVLEKNGIAVIPMVSAYARSILVDKDSFEKALKILKEMQREAQISNAYQTQER